MLVDIYERTMMAMNLDLSVRWLHGEGPSLHGES